MALTSGSRVGSYEIGSPLGAGGMGEVYRATDTNLGRQVAIKVLPEALAADADRLARFDREARTLAALNHPNIAAIYGIERTGDSSALIMELVEGPTLADRIADGAMPLDDAVPVARQIALALEAAHEQGIVHRDLKPANIKVRPDGTVKVLDFGLAKALEPVGAGHTASLSPTITSPAMMTGAGMILGTAAYMSPEQARGRAVDRRADVWAFGAVIYEMLTGRRAFPGDDVSDVLADVLRGEPQWSLLPSGIPPALVTFLKCCLRKDPKERIRDIGDVRLALDGAFDSSVMPNEAKPPAAQTKRAAWPMVAGVLVAAAAGLGAGWFMKPAAPVSVIRAAHLLPSGRTFQAVGRRAVAISPDGQQLLYRATGGLYIRRVDEVADRLIPGTDSAVSATFSPDGGSIAFVQDGQIRRMPASGGAAIGVTTVDGNPAGLQWTADSTLLYALSDGVWEVPDNGGEPRRVAAGDAATALLNPQRLPGNRWILATAVNRENLGQSGALVAIAENGERRILRDNAFGGSYSESGHLLFTNDGVLFAMPFDVDNIQVTGPPVQVIEGVRAAVGVAAISHFALSRTGTAAFLPGPVGTGRTGSLIATADRAGVVTPLNAQQRQYSNVRASRNGSQLAVDSDDGTEAMIWIVDRKGASAMRRLTFGGRNRMPVWSPDSQRVAFQSDREGTLSIYAQRADGTGAVQRLTTAPKGESHVPESWSPDGRFLSFSAASNGVFKLWILSLADGRASRFGDVESSEPIGSVFSPDGLWLAYHVRLPGRSQTDASGGVYVQPFPATGERYQAPRINFDFQPVWSASGDELLYIPQTAAGQMAAVRFTTTNGVSFGTPQTFPFALTGGKVSSAARAFDVLADNTFAGLQLSADLTQFGGTPTELRLVFNWFEELRRLTP